MRRREVKSRTHTATPGVRSRRALLNLHFTEMSDKEARFGRAATKSTPH